MVTVSEIYLVPQDNTSPVQVSADARQAISGLMENANNVPMEHTLMEISVLTFSPSNVQTHTNFGMELHVCVCPTTSNMVVHALDAQQIQFGMDSAAKSPLISSALLMLLMDIDSDYLIL